MSVMSVSHHEVTSSSVSSRLSLFFFIRSPVLPCLLLERVYTAPPPPVRRSCEAEKGEEASAPMEREPGGGQRSFPSVQPAQRHLRLKIGRSIHDDARRAPDDR